ncbi:MAG: hypothetical protein DRQ24_07870 [Candidatus Latescibacterota bacterium]|nr:MAG: hypothetical protein DRQ24_07870 [Candidatus Latescibacterota bacterium]
MKASVYTAPREFQIKEVDYPRLGENQVIIKVMACGVCKTDLHMHNGEFLAQFPLIPGHKFAGEIEEVRFGKNCIYGVLHGVGLQHCEYPYAGPKSDLILQEGVVLCVDVGLFNLPFGGIRMEDGLVVTRDGAVMLTKVGA